MRKLLPALLAAPLLLATSVASAEFKSEPGKVKFCNSLKFDTCSDKVDPTQPAYIWFEFPKPVGAAFQEAFNAPTMPLNGYYVVFISKNFETDPIVQYAGTLLVNRWNQVQSFVLTMQADDATMKSLENGTGDAARFPGVFRTQMADVGFKDQVMEGLAAQDDGDQPWEIFLFFKPFNGNETPKEMMRGKFTYNLTPENREKLAAYMNPDSRAKFAKEPDDGMKTGLHKANAGKIVFAPKKIAETSEDAGALKTDFSGASLKTGISARLFLKESVRNTYARIGWGKDVGTKPYNLAFTVDGKEIRKVAEQLDGTITQKKTTWGVTLAPENKEAENDNPTIMRKFAYVISTLPPGKHTIKVDAFVGGKGPQRLAMASGTFTISFTAAERDAFVKAQGAQLPAKGLIASDAAFAAQMKKLRPNAVSIRAPKPWENRLNAFGQITHRVTLVVDGSKKDGECRVDSNMVEQPKLANGWGPAQWSKSEKIWFIVDEDIPCQNLVP